MTLEDRILEFQQLNPVELQRRVEASSEELETYKAEAKVQELVHHNGIFLITS